MCFSERPDVLIASASAVDWIFHFGKFVCFILTGPLIFPAFDDIPLNSEDSLSLKISPPLRPP